MDSQTVHPAPPDIRQGTGSDFAQLSRKIADAGLMGRRPGYYAARIASVGGAVRRRLGRVRSRRRQLVDARGGGVPGRRLRSGRTRSRTTWHTGRSSGSRKASETNRLHRRQPGIGMGYGWWQDKHTRHHANPNHEELDPDVIPDVLVWSEEPGARRQRGCPGLLGRYQAFLFFPLLTLEGFNLHVSGVRSLADRSLKNRVAGRKHAVRALRRLPGCPAAGAAARQGRRCSSSCTRRCSGSTWARSSRPTTRACRS